MFYLCYRMKPCFETDICYALLRGLASTRQSPKIVASLGGQSWWFRQDGSERQQIARMGGKTAKAAAASPDSPAIWSSKFI